MMKQMITMSQLFDCLSVSLLLSRARTPLLSVCLLLSLSLLPSLSLFLIKHIEEKVDEAEEEEGEFLSASRAVAVRCAGTAPRTDASFSRFAHRSFTADLSHPTLVLRFQY